MLARLRRLIKLYRRELSVSEDYASLIDEPWYLSQYRHFIPDGMSALEHYSGYGVALGCDPSPCFSTQAYLDQHPELIKSGVNPLWHFLTRGCASGSRVAKSRLMDENLRDHTLARQPAKLLENLLWSGFSGEVLPLLRLKCLSPVDRRKERGDALWALARWSAFQNDYTAALAYLCQRRTIDPRVIYSKEQVLLEADCWLRCAEEARAYERVMAARRKVGRKDPDLLLALSNCFARGTDTTAVESRLAAINTILQSAGFQSLCRQDANSPLRLNNITAVAHPAQGPERAKVSVLMPAYNAGEQIEWALRSVLAQSWQNIEVLVVDDCSTDDTPECVKAIAQTDERVRFFQMPRNSGAYAARNYGLSLASGDVITVHDSDDWSHPQKLETQVRYLLDHPEATATLTDWARAREDLYFTGTFRAHAALISENTSSLMFRREVVNALGRWDLARTSADTEFVLRLRAVYGPDSVVPLHQGVPLAFALDQETSLTRTPVTHAKTLFYGARREYREAAEEWHASVQQKELKLPRHGRPFPIPSVMQPHRESSVPNYDLVVIADFNLGGGAYVSSINYVNAAIALGLRVAIFHWCRADLDVTLPLKPSLRECARRGEFDILSAGETVDAERVLVGYPVVLKYRLDAVPTIRTRQFLILVNQMAARLTDGGDPQYDPRRIHANVQALFDIEPLWVPISALVRRLMREDSRYPTPYESVWNPLLDVEKMCVERVVWRGGERCEPVLGRHARDHYTKWPSGAGALAQAYCADKPCEVRLLGGADYALNVLGRRPANWRVQEFADSTVEFLRELDFFIHFPHERYIEEFGRAVLEAMGMGIPVILPPVFEETFGDYAHYAQPDQVWPLVQRLWADETAYREAGERGLAFVHDHARYEVLAERLKQLDNTVGTVTAHDE
jgi:glycosyltransferase involved in cell wall biosynthesis